MSRQKTVSILDFEPVALGFVFDNYLEKYNIISPGDVTAIDFIEYLDKNYMLVQPIKEKKNA